MNDITKHISSIKQDLHQVLFGLNGLNDYNFDEKMILVKSKLIEVQKKKTILSEQYSTEQLKEVNPDLEELVKQIQVKFDSMIEERTIMKNQVGLEIKNNENKKKLVNYKR